MLHVADLQHKQCICRAVKAVHVFCIMHHQNFPSAVTQLLQQVRIGLAYSAQLKANAQ